MVKRNRRAGVEDRWNKTVRHLDGTTTTVPSANHQKGSRWRARYVDDAGREHVKGFRRKVDAQQWLEQQISDQVTGTWIDPALGGVTFGVLAQKWLLTKAHRAPKTVAGYESLLDTIVLPRWKDVPLRDIRYDEIQVWVSSLSMDGSMRFEGRGLSPSRVRQAHQLVGAALKFAVKAGHLKSNPADEVELPKLPEVEQRFLTHEQLYRVAMASGHLRTMILVLGYCGLRFGEAAALRAGHVDVEARRITVRRSVTYVRKRGLIEGPTKNHESRTVPIPHSVARLLATEVENLDTDSLVFRPKRGDYLTLGQARYRFKLAVAAVDGLDGIRLHDLRHTCASLSIRAGANVKVLQKLLGHKTATQTLDRYGHLFPDDLDAVAEALDRDAADDLRTVAPLRPAAGH
jgi:integrase